MLVPASKRWSQITRAQYPHEEVGYGQISDALTDREPNRVWANFDFEGVDGAFHHIDALVLSGVGLFAIDFLDLSGHVEGDEANWRIEALDGRVQSRPNPGIAVREKAKALAGTLETLLPEMKQMRVVGIGALVEPVALPARLDLRRNLVSAEGEVTLATALREGRYPGAGSDGRMAAPAGLAEQLAEAIQDGLDARIIRRADHYRRVGDWRLGELLFASPTFQDFRAVHMSDARKSARVRRFNVAAKPSEEVKLRVERGARREFAFLASMEHPGVARVQDLRVSEFGPCLFFEDTPEAMRLDVYLGGPGRALPWAARVQLFEQLVEAVRYMHGKGIIHRALSPYSVLVLDPDAECPRLQIFSWQSGDRPEGTTRGTEHLQQLLDDEAQGFMAPEVAYGLEGDESADVFSLGVLACALLGGRAPNSLTELREQLEAHKGLRLAAYANHVPAPVERVVFAATQGDVRGRLQTVDTLAERFAEALAVITDPEARDDEDLDPTRAQPGTRLGRFTVKRTLGGGGSAVALHVKDEAGRDFALKVPREATDHVRIHEEAKLMARLDHPNIVGSHGVLEIRDRPVLVMDYGGHETLRARLRGEVLGEEMLENLGDDLLGALEHIIDRGELHRDLKPSNLSLRTAGKPERTRLQVFDFSLAGVPREQLRVGSQPYRDPFLGQGRSEWDTAAEMYAAALVLHEMAAGVLPVWGDGRSAPETIDEPHPNIDAERFDPGLREAFGAFFKRALHRDAGQRFDNVPQMREAWRAAFAEVTSVHSDHPSQSPVTVDTPVGHLLLSARAVNTLDRIGVPTVADLLRLTEHTLRFMRGVGGGTRSELIERRAALLHLRAEAEALDRPAPAVTPGVERLEDFLASILPARADKGERPRRMYLGLEALDATQAPGAWPTAAEVARALEMTRANVTAHISKARKRWAEAEFIAPLRDEIERLLEEAGGVATPRQLSEALLRVWMTEATTQPERIRMGAAVARLAVEVELHDAAPRYQVKRDRAGRVLVATDPGRVKWARLLGAKADALAARDPLPAPGAVANALRALAGDEGLATAQLLRLAAAFSTTAAVSSWQELYPRGMPAERALALARNAVLTPGQRNQLAPIAPADLQARVSARYPKAEPLPPRPALDAVVERASLPLVWDEAQQAYVPRQTVALLRSGTASTQFTRTSRQPLPAPVDQSAPEVRSFEARLRDAHEPGAWCVFAVATRHLLRAHAALTKRCAPVEVSLDALLLKHLRAVSTERGIKWARLIDADTRPQDSRDWQRLGVVVSQAVDRVVAEILALDTEGAPLLLHEAGLMARYDRLGALDRVRSAVDAGTAPAPCAWLLVPNDEQRAVLDGRPLPTVTLAQLAWMPAAWVNAKAA